MGNENTNFAVLGQQLTDHITTEERRFQNMETQISGVNKTVQEIKDNHLAHLGADITDIKVSMTKNTSDTDWLKRFFWVIAGSSVGALAGSVLNLVLK